MNNLFENKYLEITIGGKTLNVQFLITEYSSNGNMAICLIEDDGSQHSVATVNLDEVAPEYAYLDTNNLPEIAEVFEKNGFAHFTGYEKQSGYCRYPLYHFYLEKMKGYVSPLSDYSVGDYYDL